MVVEFMFKIIVSAVVVLQSFSYTVISSRSRETSLNANIIEKLFQKFRTPKKKFTEKTTEDQELLEYLQTKPWRASKVRNLPIEYRPWKDSWKERYRREDDDTIYLYSVPVYKNFIEKTRIDEIWVFPWLWSKVKAERMAYIQKQFMDSVEDMSVQDFMELDGFFADHDMPFRWSILRMKEFDVLNLLSWTLCYNTDFPGVKPTDLGLRPDGTVRTCPVQFHNCLSSSNDPRDTEHYAPPLKWSRSKSPDQAYEEIKSVYFKYPKRGLSWTHGWIDRGGWYPQEFSGPYFYAKAESLWWHYADDIELVLDPERREVQYRSQMRLGQTDWDVQRLRYSEIVRLLQEKGGWEIEEIERLNWMGATPFRWTQLILDWELSTATKALDSVASGALHLIEGAGLDAGGGTGGTERGAAARLAAQVTEALRPAIAGFEPVLHQLEEFEKYLAESPQVLELVKEVQKWELSTVDRFNELTGPIISEATIILKQLDQSVDIAAITEDLQVFFNKFSPSEQELRIMKDGGGGMKTPPIDGTFLDNLLPKNDFFRGTDKRTPPSSSIDSADTELPEPLPGLSSGRLTKPGQGQGMGQTEEQKQRMAIEARDVITIRKEDFLELRKRFLSPVKIQSSTWGASESPTAQTLVEPSPNPPILDSKVALEVPSVSANEGGFSQPSTAVKSSTQDYIEASHSLQVTSKMNPSEIVEDSNTRKERIFAAGTTRKYSSPAPRSLVEIVVDGTELSSVKSYATVSRPPSICSPSETVRLRKAAVAQLRSTRVNLPSPIAA